MAGVVLGSNYPHRIIVDLSASRQDTKKKVIEMRKNSMRFNDHYGYDLITLPTGGKVRVFTKEEYRLDSAGGTMPIRKKVKGGAAKR